MTDCTSRAVAPVSAICAAFRTQPSAYPPEATKPNVAPTCGGCCGNSKRRRSKPAGSFRQKTEPQAAKPAENRAASGEAGEKTWRFSAPERPLLPAVRAVLSGKNGAFLWVGKVDWRYFSGKAKIVPLLQA